MANLTPGHYELKASFTGFANYTQTGIVLTVGQAATINVALQVAAQGERVVVTTEVQTIEPTKTEISQVINTEQIASLPISGRLFTDFALLTPGVATSRTSLGTTFTEFEVTQISFGGMRSFSNEVTVDGADFVNAVSGVHALTPPQEAVQEFRVVNNSFGAEYGRALGGIVNIVTKSGTNDLHGSVYDYFQNRLSDSRAFCRSRSRSCNRCCCLTRCAKISSAARWAVPSPRTRPFSSSTTKASGVRSLPSFLRISSITWAH